MNIVSKETVGPQAGADLRRKATMAVIWSLIGMLVYIGFRFKLEYGVSAIVTLTQDVLMALSVYSFTSREINLPIIAALLTIVGYSINDTVVVFDRVRENLKLIRKAPFEPRFSTAASTKAWAGQSSPPARSSWPSCRSSSSAERASTTSPSSCFSARWKACIRRFI